MAVQPNFAFNRATLVIVGMFILTLLGGTIYLQSVQLRSKLRDQATRKDAEHLYAVALMQQISKAAEGDLGGDIENFSDQFNIAMEISQIKKGIIAASLLEPDGEFVVALPANIASNSLAQKDVQLIQELQPVGHYHPEALLSGLFESELAPENLHNTRVPLLKVAIPLHKQNETELLGIVHFVLDAEPLAADFAALDRDLARQAGITFLLGSLVVIAVFTILAWALRGLETSHHLLLQRTDLLQKANRDLAAAARSSAVGAVSSYLIHGLSNPIAGLNDLATSQSSEASTEWKEAAAATERMQQMIADVVRVLGEEAELDNYELEISELIDLLKRRVENCATSSDVHLKWVQSGDAFLHNREANLTLLILDNLVRNAIQASAPNQTVTTSIRSTDTEIMFEVIDEGPGFPEDLLPTIFSPCRSTKAKGNGIGLTIAKQLSNHLEGSLELVETSNSGCTFTLTLPRSPLHSKLPPGSRSRAGK